MFDDYKKIIGKRVERFLLMVFPPLSEENFNQIDISAGFAFQGQPEKLSIISTDKEILDRPCIYYQSLPVICFGWNTFYSRMKEWMDGREDWIVDYEFYDVTEAVEFKDIVNNPIIDIQLSFLNRDDIPFGVKVIFENDVLLSTPIIDGNTFETLLFNRQNNLEVFRSLGKFEFKSVTEL